MHSTVSYKSIYGNSLLLLLIDGGKLMIAKSNWHFEM